MDTNNMDSSIKKKRMAVIVGIDNPIRIKSREYVLRKLFEKAKKNDWETFVDKTTQVVYKTIGRIPDEVRFPRFEKKDVEMKAKKRKINTTKDSCSDFKGNKSNAGDVSMMSICEIETSQQIT